jgi:hypothetical protein
MRLKGGTGPGMTGGGAKMVLHTTESPREWIDGAIKQFTAGSGTPHLSIGWRKGFRFPVVAQFLPFDQYAKTLEHPGGTPETNRANAVQIEICGRAAESAHGMTTGIGRSRTSSRSRSARSATRSRAPAVPRADPLHGPGLDQGAGIVGHCHAANNSHTDPGRIKAGKLLRYMKAGRQELKARA